MKPFVGLRYFTEHDSSFTGREKESALLAANAIALPVTVVYAPSGFGKSSLLRAGLVPLLRKERGVAVSLQSRWVDGINDPLTHLVEPLGGEPVLTVVILDQFEEALGAQQPNDDFFELGRRMAELLQAKDPAVSFVIAIREDAVAALNRLRPYLPGIFDNLFRVPPMRAEDARRALHEPLQKLGLEMAPELAEEVLRVSEQEGLVRLPYLQLLAEKLWAKWLESKPEGAVRLERSLIDDLGGGEQVIASHVREALSGFTPRQQEAIAAVFDRVVSESGGKLPHTLADLAEKTGRPRTEIDGLVEHLCASDKRLLEPVSESGREAHRYQLFHDVLGRPVLEWTKEVLDRQRTKKDLASRRKRLELRVAILALALLGGVVVYFGLERRALEERRKVVETELRKTNDELELAKRQVKEAGANLDHLVEEQGESSKKLAGMKKKLAEATSTLNALQKQVDAGNRFNTLVKPGDADRVQTVEPLRRDFGFDSKGLKELEFLRKRVQELSTACPQAAELNSEAKETNSR